MVPSKSSSSSSRETKQNTNDSSAPCLSLLPSPWYSSCIETSICACASSLCRERSKKERERERKEKGRKRASRIKKVGFETLHFRLLFLVFFSTLFVRFRARGRHHSCRCFRCRADTFSLSRLFFATERNIIIIRPHDATTTTTTTRG